MVLDLLSDDTNQASRHQNGLIMPGKPFSHRLHPVSLNIFYGNCRLLAPASTNQCSNALDTWYLHQGNQFAEFIHSEEIRKWQFHLEHHAELQLLQQLHPLPFLSNPPFCLLVQFLLSFRTWCLCMGNMRWNSCCMGDVWSGIHSQHCLHAAHE